MPRLHHALLIAVISAGFACSDDDNITDDIVSSVECNGDAPSYEDVTAFEKCTMCHSTEREVGDRNGAPLDVNFDTEEDADQHAEEALNEVMDGEMPPRSSGIRLTDEEKQTLYDWASCR